MNCANIADSATLTRSIKRLSNVRDVNNMAKSNTPAKKQVTLKDRFENIKEYFISVYNELKKVHWPDRRQMIAYTGVVLFAVTIVAIIIYFFDWGLSFLLKLLFDATA